VIEIGLRLKEERERLRFTQAAAADLLAVSKNTWISWEQAKTFPPADALARLGEAGGDVLYIVTGRRAVDAARGIEIEALEAVIEDLETVLAESGLVFSAVKKARLIAAAYDMCIEDGELNADKVRQFVRMAA
jgi:transcriptional regulator with XRE-family HTH domain